MPLQPNPPDVRLSVCIATFNRADFIGQTLDVILAQLVPAVELVVVDGASTDGTAEVMVDYVRRYPGIVYRREAQNCGVDRDFDKAVDYARGDYCWLMSDDDILVPGAVAKVLDCLRDDPQLLVVNAQVRDKSLSRVLKDRQLAVTSDCEFGPAQQEQFFACAAAYLSFIGGVVIRRVAWRSRLREPYYGSLFIHMGVIFQLPALGRVKVLAEPLVHIRYGNALWSARGFEIWTRLWPDLVWSFDHFSAATRQGVAMRNPVSRFITLVWYRGIGAYGPGQYRALRTAGQQVHPLGGLFAYAFPAALVNAGLALICFFSRDADAPMKLYDLGRAACAPGLTRWLARRSLFPGTGR